MKNLQRWLAIGLLAFAATACGDKKESAERDLEAQKAIQEATKKEKQMVEGMQKGVESIEKNMQEQTEKPKK